MIVACCVMAPSDGPLSVRTGAAESLMRLRVTVVALPAASVATIVTKFEPSTSATEPVNAPLGSTAIGAPLAVTVTAYRSATEPRT